MASGRAFASFILLSCWVYMVTSNQDKSTVTPTSTKSPDHHGLTMQQELELLRKENDMMMKHLAKLSARIDELEEQNTTYTVWGNNECYGAGSYKIYSGYAGGPPYGNGFGDALCLPESPSWAHYNDGYSYQGGVLGSIQYNIDSQFSIDAFGLDLNHNLMMCAVCHSPRPDVLMVPGASECNQGWTREYKGYLMGGASAGRSTGSGYLCVDEQSFAMEYNSSYPLYAAGAYLVEVRCGVSLPCEDYPDGREMACVVCSR